MICLDEREPVAARASPPVGGWASDAHRPHYRPDYARRGYCWADGALKHRTGEVFVEPAAVRDTTSWLHFLDGLEAFAPAGDVYPIVDALPLHWTLDTMLWNWGHPRFHFVPLPTAAAWLNLIEGCWTIRNQRAPAGATPTWRAPSAPASTIGTGSPPPSCGGDPRSRAAGSSAPMSIGFEERRT